MRMIRYRSAALVVALFVLLFSRSERHVLANDGLTLTDKTGEYDLALYMEVLEDPGGMLTVNDVLQPGAVRPFVPAGLSGAPNEGYAQPAHWVRIPLRNGSRQLVWLLTVDYPPMDRIDYYVIANGALIEHREAGDLIPFGKKEIQDRSFTFPLRVEKDQNIELLLRFETEGSMTYPMTLADPIDYAKRQQTDGLLLGGYYGIMLAMTLYNGILAFSLRSRINGYYVLTNASLLGLFAAFNGVAYHYLWLDAVWWNNRAVVFFMCVAPMAALLFAQNFLDLKRNAAKLYSIFSFLVGMEILNLIILGFNYPVGLQLSIYSIGLIDTMIVVAGVISMRRGYRPARLFLLGWSVFVLGAFITAMTDAGQIPYTGFTSYASQIGSVFEAVILSWGAAGQISTIKQEKELAIAQMKESSRLADSDDLTGLYNRRYLLRTFQHMVYNTGVRAVSLLLLDVDHFKQVNDSYGHDIGDSVLRRMAQILQDCFRPTDIVGRFGGEEFIVLLPNTNVRQAQRAAEYLLHMLRSQPIEAGGHSLTCTVSVGIAEWHSVFEDDFERLMRRADEALYEAKRTGRNRICTNAVKQHRMQDEA